MTKLLSVGGGYDPNRIGDIIFVHGLNGDSKSTWSYDSSETSFWPGWLAKDCPTLGIWSLEYDVASSAWNGAAMSLFDRAANVLAYLVAKGIGEKPLCFITHSMGGLLVKKMLRTAESVAPQYASFCAAVRGIIFLATPHTGSPLATLAQSVGVIYRPTSAVRELGEDESALRELNLWYQHNVDRLNIKTLSFFETQDTKGMRIVSASSADPRVKALSIPIDATHITIAKPPSHEAEVYQESKAFVTQVLLTERDHSDALGQSMYEREGTRSHALQGEVPPPVTPSSRPFFVPPLPSQGVAGRKKDLDDIFALLLISDTNRTNVPPVVLRGMGGIGKTTLAVAAGRRPELDAFFPDGVLWAELGPKPTIRTHLNTWGKALGVDLNPERDERACVDRLRNVLSGKRMLLIVDDVWEEQHGRSFLIAGAYCRTLFTTRETPIAHALATRSRTLPINVLDPQDALLLLQKLVPEAILADRAAAQRLCEKLEYLPLALKLAGSLLANEADVQRRLLRLVDELTERGEDRLNLQQSEGRKGIDEEHPVSLRAILGLSVDRLISLDRERFALLGDVESEPVDWGSGTAAAVWECSQEDAEETITHFIQHGLVEARPGERYWIHALLFDYAKWLLEHNSN